MDAYRIDNYIEQGSITLARGAYARIGDGRSEPRSSWFDRVWTNLFVPSSRPTTAAL
jgi:hypothetical protein